MTDRRFPVGARVRIVALPEGIQDCPHIVGYIGTVRAVGPEEGPRTITVSFDPDPEKLDSTGFWTFAPDHLVALDGRQLMMEMPRCGA